MTRKRPRPLLALAGLSLVLAGFSLGGCSRDTFALETMAEVSALTDEIVTTVESSTDKQAGLAEAQALLDAKAVDLEPKWNKVMSLSGLQLSDETATQLATDMLDNTTKIALLQTSLIVEAASDPALARALDELLADHEALLDGE